MFRMFAALTRDMVVANSLGSCFLVVFLMLSGYIFAQSARPPPNLCPLLCCVWFVSTWSFRE